MGTPIGFPSVLQGSKGKDSPCQNSLPPGDSLFERIVDSPDCPFSEDNILLPMQRDECKDWKVLPPKKERKIEVHFAGKVDSPEKAKKGMLDAKPVAKSRPLTADEERKLSR